MPATQRVLHFFSSVVGFFLVLGFLVGMHWGQLSFLVVPIGVILLLCSNP